MKMFRPRWRRRRRAGGESYAAPLRVPAPYCGGWVGHPPCRPGWLEYSLTCWVPLLVGWLVPLRAPPHVETTALFTLPHTERTMEVTAPTVKICLSCLLVPPA
jgi:hypothetical protein